MMATVALWSHALAALIFALLALSQWTGSPTGLPRRSFSVALGVTALWALAVAGIDPRDVSTRVAEGARNLAWLAFMFALVRGTWRRGGLAVASLYGAVVLAVLAATAISVAEAALGSRPTPEMIAPTRLALRMMAALGALVLVEQLLRVARDGPRLALGAIAAIWGCDLAVYAAMYGADAPVDVMAALRGVAMTAIAPVLAVATLRRGDWALQVSRIATLRSLSALVLLVYLALVALATQWIGAAAGERARLFQTAIVFGSAMTLLTFVSTPWLRAWMQVKLSKHLFRHRYDYRSEWLRFTDTLGQPGAEAAPLDERIVKAVADLTCSPAGLLLVPDGAGLGVGAGWNWDRAAHPATGGNEVLARLLAVSPRIIELDPARATLAMPAGAGEDIAAALPQWMLDRQDAWALVPLPHFGALAGAILLARPPVDRRLDWEDFDLLRLAGRQVASYLAEDRAHAALADAHRFDEFNRRFAFILHDIKNLVSQLSLVAHNAERHAANPAFRADMVATLKDSACRMNALLARLSQHHTPRPDALQPVELADIAERIARARRAIHPIAIAREPAPLALADPARLEQLLGHLVQNAIEASPANEPVTLAVVPVGGGVAIDVVDHGAGMNPAFVRDQLFRPFVSSKPGGFGIGAFEARQLAEAMGGRVEVTSREGEGTRIRVLLSAAGAATLERAA